MPNDLSIAAVSPITAVTLRTEPYPALPAVNQPTPLCAPGYPNPALHIDPSSNIVVIAFHNAAGELVDQTPSPRQLDAYRQSMTPKVQALPDK